MSNDVREWAHRYQQRGFALARILPGEKRPTYPRWNRFSFPADHLTDQDSIGIQSGRLSGDLVCVDLDSRDALAEADRILPSTAMVEGRPGKPVSHRWYRAVDVPEEWTAACGVGGGPRTVQFARPGAGPGRMVVELRGTGSQAVVPPSLWTTTDGHQQERRVWYSFGEPATVPYVELLEATARLAAACGGRNTLYERRTRPGGRQASRAAEAPALLPMPTGDVVLRARAYLAKVPPAVEGEGGDRRTWTAACYLVRDFGLTPEQALPLLLEWNQRCSPPWSVEALVHKLEESNNYVGPRGRKVRRRSSRRVEVCLRPGDKEVFVGVDCAGPGRSFVDLQPDVWAALIRHGHAFTLHPRLAALDWTGKMVFLTTPSNVATNRKVVRDEARLAHALQERGAAVFAVRVPSPDGRRITYGQALAGGAALDIVLPPQSAQEVEAAARAVVERTRLTDGRRRALPREKGSPALSKAVNWLEKHAVDAVTKDVLKKAKRAGIPERTLKRGAALLKEKRNTKEMLRSPETHATLCDTYLNLAPAKCA